MRSPGSFVIPSQFIMMAIGKEDHMKAEVSTTGTDAAEPSTRNQFRRRPSALLRFERRFLAHRRKTTQQVARAPLTALFPTMRRRSCNLGAQYRRSPAGVATTRHPPLLHPTQRFGRACPRLRSLPSTVSVPNGVMPCGPGTIFADSLSE